MTSLSILVIDDEPLMRMSIVDALQAVGHDVQEAADGTEGLALLQTKPFDLVITDLRLPGADGVQIVRACQQAPRKPEVIVITAHGSVDTAVQAMKSGAHDYITKPFSMDELLLIVARVADMVALRQENVQLREELKSKFAFEGIVGKSQRMRDVLEKVKLVAKTDATVLIAGESGTGKELIANAIHHNSPRRAHPLIKVSCAALPETLLEAELFGHEKGAFTGALKQRRGRFELAHRGTLFLDEIGEISPVVQVKLLRVLQERQFERVGGTETIDVDVRLVCATQKDLKKEVAAGRFREDLYYRLNVVPIELPPLRERREDILAITEHLLHVAGERLKQPAKTLSPKAREILLRYPFPGNVRELENTIERAVALAQLNESIEAWDLCGEAQCPFLKGGEPLPDCGFCAAAYSVSASSPVEETTLSAARERFERTHILEVLHRADWSKTTAAKMLGVSRKALWEKCKRYGIITPDDGHEP